jgi:hypothetical protein
MTCCIMLSLKYSLKCCTSLNLFEFGFENSIEKGMEKELENSEKKKRIKQPSRPKSAEPGRAPAPSDRQIPPVSGSSPLRALSPLLAAQWGRSVGASFCAGPRGGGGGGVGPARAVSWARIARHRAGAPRAPFLSIYVVGLPCQFRPLRARRGPARAHSRTSPDFSATTPAHMPSSLLRAPQVPALAPLPHFAQHHPLSRSAHATSRRRRPAPVFPTIHLARDRSKPPRPLPQGETLVPVPNFPYCALCSANFTFVGARPRRSAVLTRWPADLARSSSPE